MTDSAWQEARGAPQPAVTPTPLTDPMLQARSLIARYYFGTAAVAMSCGALLQLVDGHAPGPLRTLVAALFLAAALGSVMARRLVGRAQDYGITAVSSIAIVLIALTAVVMRWGINSASLGFLGLIPCMVCTAVGMRHGAFVAALAMLAGGGLAWAEHLHALEGFGALAPVPVLRRFLDVALLVATGLAAGMLLAHIIGRLLQAGAERERRFIDLLGIAADRYWEMDAQFRITHLWQRNRDGEFVAQTPPSIPPWERPGAMYDEDVLDAHRADLEAWRPFRHVATRVVERDGSVRHETASGEPRFDARGVFTGYWGVARDVTADIRAREAHRASEVRYHELFTRTPTPLVLHRRGRVLDANPAAVALFGFADLDALYGQDLLALYESDEQRALARERLDVLETLPLGRGLPVAEQWLRSADGRSLVVRATAVRLQADGGPAALSIYVDDTERRAAEDAVRRSEALLSHLVAMSPDVITLTDLATGRYAMANDTFMRLSGYTREEVIGRTSGELGIWGRAHDRVRMVEALRDRRVVKDMPVEFVAKSGERFALLVSGARFQMDGREYLVINGRDVTEAERARLEREAILENASIGIALTRDRVFQLANPRFEQMFGWPRGALTGRPGEAVWPDRDAYERFGIAVGPALGRGEPVEVEYPMRRHDGSTFLCRLQARAVDPTHPSRGGTIWLAEDVTDRRAVEQALAKARDDAEAASEAKSAFLANTSHEIRTPLNGLVGLARLAQQPDISDALRQQYVEQISESAETLAAIISDILDLSKIEAGKLHLETVAFDLQTLLRTLHRGYATLADARGLTLSLEIDPGLPARVQGDPVRVRQILGNYVTNALKFTPRGSTVLAARPIAGDRVRFEVRDTGPGIDAATQERLFSPFMQADQSTTRRYGGTGLGLSICRELARLMGGEVGVVSTPGEGSCFWAELPLAAALDDDPTSGFGALDERSPLADLRVLMVEDNAVNMLIAVALLEQWGVRVEQAGDGREAVAAVARAAAAGRPFDAVLMDVQMPVMSGYEATRALREQYGATQLPIIALTAAALTSEREQALAAGMNDFLTKPIDPQRLHDALVRLTSPP